VAEQGAVGFAIGISRAFRRNALLILTLCSLIGLAIVIRRAPSIEFWRHDPFAYLSEQGIELRVQAEGRWLNFLTYPFIRKTSAWHWWTLDVALLVVALYLIFRRLVDERLIAINSRWLPHCFPAWSIKTPGRTRPVYPSRSSSFPSWQ
jgi:hypothetical protein